MRGAKLAIAAALVLSAPLLSGCGLTRKLAVGTMTPILQESIEASYRDRDLKTIRRAIPGNLILLRGLCESEPGDRELRRMAAELYFSYAMGFIEDEDSEWASALYQEGLRLGREGLSRRSWFRRAEKAAGSLPDSTALANLPAGDAPLLFWTLANWSGWISLNLSSPEAVAQLPRLQAYLEALLRVAPDYFLGMPRVLMGSIETLRPRMLGGNPEEGQRQFQEAFRVSGRKMLYFQVAYARYYCRQMLDEECFDTTLEEVLNAPPDLLPEYRLFNEVAKEKARHLQEIRDELF